jgi:predicted transcriptional regulator
MARSAVVTTRLDAKTVELVDRIVEARGQSRSWFVARVVSEAVKREEAFLAFVQQGVDELDRGEGIAHEVVMAELDAMIARHEARCQD